MLPNLLPHPSVLSVYGGDLRPMNRLTDECLFGTDRRGKMRSCSD
jgi:hypothetical protein